MKRTVKTIHHRCQECRKQRAKGIIQQMAPLPAFRFKEPLRAFSTVGIDMAGPFEVRIGRRLAREKHYICLFSCLKTRAIHLEVTKDLSTGAFLRALQRFISRRGKPEIILSDNGRNFIGAHREVCEIQWDGYKAAVELKEGEIKWILNPPGAPHFGGTFEIMVRALKRSLNVLLPEAQLYEEEFWTIVTIIEGILNSRPITTPSGETADQEPLTPNHFVIPGHTGRWDIQLTGTKESPMNARWRYIQQLADHFWKRWRTEWLTRERERAKWQRGATIIREGDLVWLLDDCVRRGKWKTGRIVKTYPGRDGIVRVVEVLIDEKRLKLPVGKICLIEENSNEVGKLAGSDLLEEEVYIAGTSRMEGERGVSIPREESNTTTPRIENSSRINRQQEQNNPVDTFFTRLKVRELL